MPTVGGNTGVLILIGSKAANEAVLISIFVHPGEDGGADLIGVVEGVGHLLILIPDLKVNAETRMMLAVAGKSGGRGITVRKILLSLVGAVSGSDLKIIKSLFGKESVCKLKDRAGRLSLELYRAVNEIIAMQIVCVIFVIDVEKACLRGGETVHILRIYEYKRADVHIVVADGDRGRAHIDLLGGFNVGGARAARGLVGIANGSVRSHRGSAKDYRVAALILDGKLVDRPERGSVLGKANSYRGRR